MTEYHDDETLRKVVLGLAKAGITNQKASDAIREMQNAGILFRELVKDDADFVVYYCIKRSVPGGGHAYECATCGVIRTINLVKHAVEHGKSRIVVQDKTHILPVNHFLTPEQQVAEATGQVRRLVSKRYLNSRERSLALTKLEEADLWLSKAREVDFPEYPIPT